jgi:hypothetical protein
LILGGGALLLRCIFDIAGGLLIWDVVVVDDTGASAGGEGELMLDILGDVFDIVDNSWSVDADVRCDGGWLMVMFTLDDESDCDMTLLFDEGDDWAT